ncbi:D-2-hydroxyacid dehydrogenase [Rhizobium bangladeshense]|uniref:D-2-hydroxyacid dehydrogenase n=1 Tax=Rhizobium bangladeshense TaxID=1138189 RepID=UPI0009ED7525|nr:D-2-hydroxyacid dehydrogenase [Rhizobium bangladeshense]
MAQWFEEPRIYVENVPHGEPAYEISADDVVTALSDVCRPEALTCRYADDRDLEAFRRADIFVASKLDRALITTEGENLRLIQCTSAGVEKYAPFDWLKPSVLLTNASGVHAQKAGEFGLMATLMLQNHVPAMVTRQRRHVWSRQLRAPASGTRVMVFGVGALGGAIAGRLKANGFHVTGVRRSGEPHDAVDYMITPDAFITELTRTDILILTCPLTEETRSLVSFREFAAMPPGAGLLNLSRGQVVDHSALVPALKRGQLSGAILDVFDIEPLPVDSELWDAPNLMVFPHVSADSPDGYNLRCLAILAENLERARSGKQLRNVVNPELGY